MRIPCRLVSFHSPCANFVKISTGLSGLHIDSPHTTVLEAHLAWKLTKHGNDSHIKPYAKIPINIINRICFVKPYIAIITSNSGHWQMVHVLTKWRLTLVSLLSPQRRNERRPNSVLQSLKLIFKSYRPLYRGITSGY